MISFFNSTLNISSKITNNFKDKEGTYNFVSFMVSSYKIIIKNNTFS